MSASGPVPLNRQAPVVDLFPTCASCDEPATIVSIEVGEVQAEISLCVEHLDRLLEGARPVPTSLSDERMSRRTPGNRVVPITRGERPPRTGDP